jgi:hypothetical protein
VTLCKVTQLTPEQARKIAADMLATVRLGGDPATEKAERRAAITVGELIDLFDAQYVGPMLKPGTAISHRIALEELRRSHGALKAVALTRAHVATLHVRMADRPYAANRAAAVWSKAFAWGTTRGLIPEGHNPTKGLQKYREQGRERFLTTDELARLGAALVEGEKDFEAKHIKPEQEARFVADPWEEKIAAHIQNLSRVTVGMVAKDALFIETARISMRDSYRIIDVLTSLGWTMTRSNGARWYKPRDSAA